MILLEAGTLETVQIISLIVSGIAIPILGFALAIAVRHGWLNKKQSDTLQEDLKDLTSIAKAATTAIEKQKEKNPEVAKDLTTEVVSKVENKEKLDNFLKKIDLNQ